MAAHLARLPLATCGGLPWNLDMCWPGEWMSGGSSVKATSLGVRPWLPAGAWPVFREVGQGEGLGISSAGAASPSACVQQDVLTSAQAVPTRS